MPKKTKSEKLAKKVQKQATLALLNDMSNEGVLLSMVSMIVEFQKSEEAVKLLAPMREALEKMDVEKHGP